VTKKNQASKKKAQKKKKKKKEDTTTRHVSMHARTSAKKDEVTAAKVER